MRDEPSKKKFRIGPGRVELKNGDTRVSAMADYGEGCHELEVLVRDHELALLPPTMGDALLSIALMAAMTRGQTLEVADPVSPQLLEGVEQIQRIMHMWYPYLSMVEVEATPFTGELAPSSAGGGKRAQFFSGGVDSLYSTLEGLEAGSLHSLVFVGGTDLFKCSSELRRETNERLGEIAARLDLPLVIVETNIREWATVCGRHCDDFTSARLAVIAHLLGELFEEWIIAPTILGRIDPFFSHPMVDPLWSTKRIQVLHPVPHRTRAEKIWDLAQQDGYLENLRICMWGEEFNCGDCRKCIRTLLTLKVLGVADRAPVFTKSPEIPEIIKRLNATTNSHSVMELEHECQFLRETIDKARELGAEKSLIDQLERTFENFEARLIWRRVERSQPEVFLQSRWEKVPFEARRACFRKLLAINPEWLAKELAADLPEQKEAVFASLWKSERRWLRRRLRKASVTRLAQRLGFRR